MVNQMLLSEKPKEGLCQHCRQETAVVRCHDCLPRPLFCVTCDFAIHRSMVLHNRASMVEGFFRPLPPSTYIKEDEGGKFSFHERGTSKLQNTCNISNNIFNLIKTKNTLGEIGYRTERIPPLIKDDDTGINYIKLFSPCLLECFLPIVLPCCDCSSGKTTVSTRKQVILIGMNGHGFF